MLRPTIVSGMRAMLKLEGRMCVSTNRSQQNVAPSAEASPSPSQSDKHLHYAEEEGYYKTSPFEPVELLNTTVDRYVWRDWKKWEKNIAAECVVSGRKYTYAQMRDASAALAVRIQNKFKLRRGDVVGICLPNTPEYPIATLGLLEAGTTVTTINPIYTADEIGRQITYSNAKLIIGTCTGFETIKKACALAQKDIPIIVLRMRKEDTVPPGAIDFFEMINSHNVDYADLKVYDFNAADIAFLPFSSGTTGLPKGVQLTHNNITINCEQVQTPINLGSGQDQDVLPAVLPFFHIYGLTVVMLSKLGMGYKLATMPQFKPDDLLKSLQDHKGSILNLVPPIALFMIHSPKVNAETAPALRMVMSGAAPIGVNDVERFMQKFKGCKFLQGYGMTESSPVLLMTPENNTRFASTGFLASNTEAKIVRLDGSEIKGQGPNVTGELCVRGPQVMTGYLNNEEANKETFHPGRWLRTGDVAYYDEDGYFYITDRMKELIKVKGFQVPPAELEAILRNHPKILEAAVFGIPHDQHGEVPRALVVLRPNMEASEEEIYNYVAEQVAVYKRLDGGIVFDKEVPKNPTGKILRKELKEKYSS